MGLSFKTRLSTLLLAAAGVAGGIKFSDSTDAPREPVTLSADAKARTQTPSSAFSLFALGGHADPQEFKADTTSGLDEGPDESQDVTPEEEREIAAKAAQERFLKRISALENYAEFKKLAPGSKKFASLYEGVNYFLQEGEDIQASLGITREQAFRMIRETAIESSAVLKDQVDAAARAGDHIQQYELLSRLTSVLSYAGSSDDGLLHLDMVELRTGLNQKALRTQLMDQVGPLALRQSIDYLRQTPEVTDLSDPRALEYDRVATMLRRTLNKPYSGGMDARYSRQLDELGLTSQTAEGLLKLGGTLTQKIWDRGIADYEARTETRLKDYRPPQPG